MTKSKAVEKGVEHLGIDEWELVNTAQKKRILESLQITAKAEREELNKKLSSVMNVRNDEKAMRLLIIEIQKWCKK